ncbi:NAD-dependent dehydratase [Rhizobium sp. Root274]|uniref:NAD(P)H-binding protein n=1 Tax=unclassified Rhizobium TaxID=2613769 RepID=UPI00071275F8|nr:MULTISPECIES: NAD(P)H-binding protein [unclassified Rhizobium]KQW27424.1 NAD-dependent dehydratase [Rhizobium sp. Root1240]KRD27660.1 NAD-dependent dehydratase [Rhizobium sp. Root274]
MKLLILGATGLVGSRVLDLALTDPRVTSVTAPTRRPLPKRPGLSAPVVDFEALPQDPLFWTVDAVICALGTTLKTAGSRERFHRVDHDYPVEIARLAKAHGARTFVLNSAKGADLSSLFFYSRVKGETERDVEALGFESTVIVRPGLIDGPRTEPRPLEAWAGRVLSLLKPILPRSARANPPGAIARVMLDATFAARPGVTVVPSQDLL